MYKAQRFIDVCVNHQVVHKPTNPYAKVDRHQRYFIALVVVAMAVVVLPIAVVVATVATAVGAGGETVVTAALP